MALADEGKTSGTTAAEANNAPAETTSTRSADTPPDHQSGPPEEIWPQYFREHQPSDRIVRRTVLRLHTLGEHEHVIHALQSALINGQSQPWMYEVLALSMEVAGRPKDDVQRVVLSLTDFGSASVESMMYSAAYLTRFGREEPALRLYRQASRMAPERPEPYILGLRLARNLKQAEGVGWAAAGVLMHGWTADYERIQRDAEDAALEAEEWLSRSGDEAAARDLRQTVTEAKRRDLRITLTWNGTADLDLIVEEPTGTVCSFETPETLGGGIHLHDGYGPVAENCIETYVCPRAVAGEYRVRVRHVSGDVVGKRAQVTITQQIGTAEESTTRQTVVLSAEDAVVSFKLGTGRRQRPRTVSTRHLDPRRALQMAQSARSLRRQGELTPEEEAAFRRFQEARELSRRQIAAQTNRPFVTGAVGFQPVITLIPDGVQLTVQAIVSPDRRYVRVGVNPVFSTLTDVFTFSFVSGTNPFGGLNTGLGGAGGAGGLGGVGGAGGNGPAP